MTKASKTKSKNTKAANTKTKSERLIGLLCRSTGASIAEMIKATGWQAHSVRGFLAGSLKKKGYSVSSELDGSGIRHYRSAEPVKS